ncbi:MAG TPA: TlpA disulfide reductase family protein [Edaphobacter sp.]
MRYVLLLLLTTASCACAQTPQELLRLAQDTYKSPEGYLINGKGSVQPSGSSWQINFDVLIAAAPSPLGNPQVPAVPGGGVGGHMQFVNVLGGTDEKPTSVGIPFAVTGLWSRISENVDSVTETGSETLPLNGTPTACRVLQVEYKAPADVPKPSPATYSICSDRHLVLKKVIIFPTGRHSTDPPVPWTITFDTAKFNRPAPQWLLDLKELPTVTIRKEWLGHPAPEFKLSDLNGNSVALSSMRGKVVLLDFWSISCGPCIREMPMIEAAGETHKGDLVVWGVSFDQPDRDKKWLLQHQRTLPTLSDTDFVASDLYKVHGIPALVLIGTDGKIKNYWQGEVPESDLEIAIRRASRH